jgi:hypothetical protein
MDPKLEQAIQAIKSGNKVSGLVLLAQVIRSDPNNESAWIWMATAQDDPEKKKQSLERVLHINPGNERVRRALSVMFPPAADAAQETHVVEAVPETQPEPPVVVEQTPVQAIPTPEVVPAEPETSTAGPAELVSPVPSETAAGVQEPEPIATDIETSEVAGPDLSWLKETSAAAEELKEEAPDLSWLKEDLPIETSEAGVGPGVEAVTAEIGEQEWLKESLQPEEPESVKEEVPPDLSWLKEDQSEAETSETSFSWPDKATSEEAISDQSWMKEEPPAGETKSGIPPTPTGEKDDLAWLRAVSAGPAGEPETSEELTSTPSEEADLSWLDTAPASQEETETEPTSEPAFPWLNEAPTQAGGQAVKNEDEDMPEWLRQGLSEESQQATPVPIEGEPSPQETPTLESEPLRPEDLDEITTRHAELPFTWDEVTGEPVLKTTGEISGPTAAAEQEGSSEAESETQPVKPTEAATVASSPISRPKPAAVPTTDKDTAAAKSAQKKVLTTGQILLLGFLGLATLIILLAFAFYLAVNFGLLKAFGF